MKITSPIDIDILTFFKTGKFDILKPGQTKEWILNNFPDPDEYGMGDFLMEAKIWFYGNIELHFDKAELFLICSEYVNQLEGGQSINLNTWILSGLNTLTLQFVIEHLNNERIDFTKFNDKVLEDYVRIHLTDSQIQLTFIGEDDNSNRIVNPNLYRLAGFSLLLK